MGELIERLLAVEAEARQRLERARAEAEQILCESRQQAEKIVADAREAARAQARATVLAAVADAERERQELLRAATLRCEKACTLPDDLHQELVTSLVRFVCGTS